MISKVLDLLGLKSITTPLVFGGVVLFGAAAAATWMREDAISDCNVRWELKLTSETLALKAKAAELQFQTDQIAHRLRDAEEKLKEKQDAEVESLAHQKANYPLSAECLKCRVPNERIWVRPEHGTKKQSVPAGKPAS